jgi:hypothetical protein
MDGTPRFDMKGGPFFPGKKVGSDLLFAPL